MGDFNPRSPRGERHVTGWGFTSTQGFQSTLPARGATFGVLKYRLDKGNFNPRSPRGERPAPEPMYICNGEFQSTLPARGATNLPLVRLFRLVISIHAPREGSDFTDVRAVARAHHFNPRSPRGERRDIVNYDALGVAISIHAPREGSDDVRVERQLTFADFNPRSPRGERLSLQCSDSSSAKISIHAPREGSDLDNIVSYKGFSLFQSTLPARGATSSAKESW